MFELRVPLWELVARGSLVYLFLFVVFRVVLRRDAGSLGLADVLLVVLIADASQNAMAGGYESVPEGIVLMATIVGWNVLFDWLDYRFPALRRLLLPKPLVLVRNGVLQRRAMRRELVTTEELMAKLREHDASTLAEVELAIMESDGEISVKKRDPATAPPHRPPSRRPPPGVWRQPGRVSRPVCPGAHPERPAAHDAAPPRPGTDPAWPVRRRSPPGG